MSRERKQVKENFRISRIYGAYYEVYSPETGAVRAHLRGKLRTHSSGDRHPFVVGDYVRLEKKGENWVIQDKLERRNGLSRKSRTGPTQVLCANVDSLAVLASLAMPETKSGFIDRCLCAAFEAEIPVTIVFTKKDLLTEPSELPGIYRSLGMDVLEVSAVSGEGMSDFERKLEGKTTFLVGNSGVGKSTLLNLIAGEEMQKTNLISRSTTKGKHTTTNSNLVPVSESTYLIDSPGIKEWGLLHISADRVLESFPEFRNSKNRCQSQHCCDFSSECQFEKDKESGKYCEMRIKSLDAILESLQSPHRVTRRDLWENASRD